MLTPKMSMFTPFALIHGPNIPGSYAALDLAAITSLIHNWVLFLLWLCLFILSNLLFSYSALVHSFKQQFNTCSSFNKWLIKTLLQASRISSWFSQKA